MAASPARRNPNKLTATDLCDKARWQASKPKRFPYLAKALWALTFIETDLVPTMAVDKFWRVYINPAHIDECVKEHFDTVIVGVIHECLHPSLHHDQRAKTIQAMDHGLWNQCGDCELVQMIREGAPDLHLWSKDLTPEKMGWPLKLSAEEYYKLAQQQQKKQGGGGTKCSGGSGVDGIVMPWELPAPGDPGFQAGKTPAGLSAAEQQIIRLATAHAIKKHAESHGNVPAGLIRWADEFLAPPDMDWHTRFAGRMQYHVDAKRGPVASYARPSRRSAGALILPIHRTPRPKLGVVGDTSGSMEDRDLAKVEGLVWDAIEALGSIYATGCDAAAQEPVECRHLDDLREVLRGGGGTAMDVGIQTIIDRVQPDAVAVVTDGYTGWPAEDPGVPVIVVLTRPRDPRYSIPSWVDDVIDASDTHAAPGENIP